MFQVQSKPCSTCIYRADMAFDLEKLENQVRDRFMPEHFSGYRICHHSDSACCRGFFNAHGNNCAPIQLATRLGVIGFVNHDNLESII